MDTYDGGRFFGRPALIRAGIHRHTADGGHISDATLDALNAIQETPWEINTFIQEVMETAWASGMDLAGLPRAEDKPLPARTTDDLWAAMSDDDKRAHKARLSDVHAHNASLGGKRESFLDKLAVAREMAGRRFWFDHSLDFRGRFYPEPGAGPTPQSDGMGRALLRFADGLPLGDTGLYWLCVRAAGCYGQDKVSMDERVQWVMDHMAEVEDSARNPLDGAMFWAQTDEDPWGFLATCHEISEAFAEGDPAAYVSRLPVPLDGTCNGLQHLSAMGRDPMGARATNLSASAERFDIYVEVAEVVKRLVREDAMNGVPEALEWVGKVVRKTVKRAVMTTPYGVTDRGIRDQLLADGAVDGERENKSRRADYMRDKIVQALGETVVAAKDVMAWLQAIASKLAQHQVPFAFTTPTGNRIIQSYYVLTQRRVTTLVGTTVLWEEDKRAGLNARKQALASAPNFIHAFDASHCALTVNAGVSDGITSWAVIHDSFGTHAANTRRLGRHLREQFVALYERKDWLRDLYDALLLAHPEVDLPEPPAQGTFDVAEVRDSPFFFS